MTHVCFGGAEHASDISFSVQKRGTVVGRASVARCFDYSLDWIVIYCCIRKVF